MTQCIHLDFTGAHSTTVRLNGWPARLANVVRVLLGVELTLAICKKLPLSKPRAEGLLAWAPGNTYSKGEWALCWHDKFWYSFTVARANTDAQLRCFREGGLTYRVERRDDAAHV